MPHLQKQGYEAQAYAGLGACGAALRPDVDGMECQRQHHAALPPHNVHQVSAQSSLGCLLLLLLLPALLAASPPDCWLLLTGWLLVLLLLGR